MAGVKKPQRKRSIGKATWTIAGLLAGLPLLIAGIVTSFAASGPRRIVEVDEIENTISSLKGVTPLRGDVSEYIVDKVAAQQLGKALFWDIQVGSSGVACASCHFHGGADIRTKNQADPGVKAADITFATRFKDAGLLGPNKDLKPADFPLHRLENPADRQSAVLYDTNDVVSSQGSFGGLFVSSNLSAPQPTRTGTRLPVPAKNLRGASLPSNETCTTTYDPGTQPFHANGLIYRKVEPRNTPTAINAVFNNRQFWDGRANNQFNGIDPFGPRTFYPQATAGGVGNPDAARAGTLVAAPAHRTAGLGLALEKRLIDNASLASQAVGPPLSDFEMSCGGKTFADLGRKLIPLQALAVQRVDPMDSLFSKTPRLVGAKGLTLTYKQLIEKAFAPKFWSSLKKVAVLANGTLIETATGFTQMEQNFSLFWGLAIQEYEALLVSDDSAFDRAKNGTPAAMSDQARAGENVFMTKGQCVNCHMGPLFSGATVTKSSTTTKAMEHMRVGNGAMAFYDKGYYNIGVRPSAEDLGVGATDPYGFDLSFSRQYKWRQLGRYSRGPDNFDAGACSWQFQFWPCTDEPTWMDPAESERDAVDGAFKTPILRNVGLNPPYFHNGGQATLKDVVRFYNRGGDRRGPLDKDSSGMANPNPFGQTADSNLHPDIGDVTNTTRNNALGLSEAEMDDLVAFLLSLTDERVACHSGAFDHPELPISMGHLELASTNSQMARDVVRILPATGRFGLKAAGKACFPNSGSLFGSVNALDPRPLQVVFMSILGDPDLNHMRFFGPNSSSLVQTAAIDTVTLPSNVTVTASMVTPTAGMIPTSVAAPATLDTGLDVATVPGVADPFGTRAGTARPPAIFTPAAGTVTITPPAPPPVPAPTLSTAVRNIHAFTAIGFVQQATVSGASCPALPRRRWGGTAVVNGISIIIPCNTILQMPANTLTWAEMLPASLGGVGTSTTSLLLPPQAGTVTYPSTELRVEGNIVDGRYIAGLVFVSQQSLNTATGYITGFDNANGVIFVGDKAGGPAQVRLQLNDPAGRFSKGQSPDGRFSVDDANPTVRSITGYPMCVPRSATANDPLCPQRNRPLAASGCRTLRDAGVTLPIGRDLLPPPTDAVYCPAFVMGNPATAAPTAPTSTQQAPFAVGDQITWSGTLMKGDGKGPNGSDTVSVHTLIANVGIFTQPGTLPVYLAIGEFRVGNFTPTPVVNGVPQELQDRLVLEAVVTDVTSIVDIYMVDVNPTTGAITNRWVTPGTMTGGIGAIGSNGHIIDGGITTQFDGPVPGRVRIRANRAVANILNSPTRNIRVVARTLCDPANVNETRLSGITTVACIDRAPAANGLKTGQYMAPTFEYILPENVVPGDPIVPNNFWNLGFLINGEGPNTGRLAPTPW
jgi:cytochrome c peroxidase